MGAVLSTIDEIFWAIALSCIFTVGSVYAYAGWRALKTLELTAQSKPQESFAMILQDAEWKQWLPFILMGVGILISIIPTCVSAALIATLYVKIPYACSVDFAIGLGIGQGLLFLYIHWGKMKFLHKI